MSTRISPLAGQPVPKALLIDVDQLVAAYFSERPDPSVPAQRVAFGTSGHRGSACDVSFNEWHVLAITQALCDHRKARGIAGPLFMGIDTHALSAPACASALEVLAANGLEVMLATNDEPTPTPAVSHAILTHNRGVAEPGRRADGIVVTPSHNPPRDGGFKYNPPHGGPASHDITDAIQAAANRFLEQGLDGVRRLPHAQALAAATTHRHDYLAHYVAELDQVIDLDAIRNAGLRLGVDPLGGAGVHYWAAIAERWELDLTVVSTQLIDPIATRLDRRLYEVPVGFKWFSQGLLDGSLGFGGEESAGAAFLRRDGRVWTTDKDGMIAALLAAEITARCGRDPGALYLVLAGQLGSPVEERIEAPATPEQKVRLAALSPQQIGAAELSGEAIVSVLSQAPGNGAPIGGIKVSAKSGWYAARPSGTEDLYKIYAESFQGPEHMQRILVEAQATVDSALALPSTPATPSPKPSPSGMRP